ncbi:MAG: hypothetical protein IH794_07630, partial [Acidobacteria bacterium]|nr:hypothetical protein [Acidobacteriota bacterium]
DYGVWVDETGTDWSYQNIKPFADQINRDFNIHARPDVLITPLDHLFRDTAQSMGYSAVDATIAKKNCLLSGYCDGINHCRYDARQGSQPGLRRLGGHPGIVCRSPHRGAPL